MTNTVQWKSIPPTPCKYNAINKTRPVYVCYDCELETKLTTDNKRQAIQYCKENNCKYSEYPTGTYEHFIDPLYNYYKNY